MLMLPVLRKVYCATCQKWLNNQNPEGRYEVYMHDEVKHPFGYGKVSTEQRWDN